MLQAIGRIRRDAHVLWVIVAFAIAAFLQLSAPGNAGAETADTTPLTETESFILGNVVFALFHEIGHAIISEFDVPLLGLEENSADTIAAASLILLDREAPEQGYGVALGAAALVQAYVWESGVEKEYADALVWAQHGFSAQRFARLVCLLYGSDPERFGWVSEAAGMSELRADGCEHEWRVAETGLRWLHERVAAQRSAAGGAGTVSYGPATSPETTAMRDLLRRRELLERIAASVDSRIGFHGGITFRATSCPVPNAYWDADYREIVLCYELMTSIESVAGRPDFTAVIERFHPDTSQISEGESP